jgi:hypothetical protein
VLQRVQPSALVLLLLPLLLLLVPASRPTHPKHLPSYRR